MMIPVRSLLGLGSIPSHRASAVACLSRLGLTIHKINGNGGLRDAILLSDLPDPERLAFLARRAETMGLPMGVQDDAAHLALAAKPVGVQNTAYARADTMMFIAKHEAAGLKWRQIAGLLEAEAAKAASAILVPSRMTSHRWARMIAGLDPVNWAPALAPAYEGKKECAEIAAEAWDHFEFLIAAGGKNGTGFPLLQAYQRTMDHARHMGWAVDASYRTFLRRWEKLPAARRRTLRDGADHAAASLTMYQPRSVTQVQAMQQVELDGREFGVVCRFRDGTLGCPWVIMIVDRASSKVLGWSISTSENAEAVREAIITVCEEHGIPDLLLTDNGAAINSRTIIGGLKPRYRTKQMTAPEWEVPGVMAIYGIELQNTAPGAPRGKLPESIFSALRHVDNSPEFHGAQRSGPNDIPNPNPVPIDIDLFEAVLVKRMCEFNSMTHSRAQGLKKGECRDSAFERLHQGRARRHVSPLQRRSVPMIWKPRKVMGDGRVKFLDGLFGDATTQEAMLHHEGKVVLIGIDPNDYHAPAIVRGWEDPHLKGRVLIEKLPAYATTSVRSEEGRRRAASEKRRASALAKFHKPKDMDARLADLRAGALSDAPQTAPVVPKVHQLDTRGPFSPAAAFHQIDPKTGEVCATNEEAEAAQAALLEFMFPTKGMERREASGGNR